MHPPNLWLNDAVARVNVGQGRGVDLHVRGTVPPRQENSMSRFIPYRKHALVAAIAAAALTAVAIAAPPQSSAPDRSARQQAMFDQLDANSDGAISRSEAAANPRLAQRFDQIDANNDGRLSREELAQARAQRGEGQRGKRGHGMMGQFKALDTDGDGRISRAEAAANPQLAARFAELDANNDGYIDRADMQARMQQRRAEFFTQADSNNDGRLSRAEFDAAHAARHARMAERMQQRRAERSAQGTAPPARVDRPQRERTPPTAEQRAERTAQMFSRMDSNNDGYISRAEYDAAAARMGEGRRGGKGGMRGAK